MKQFLVKLDSDYPEELTEDAVEEVLRGLGDVSAVVVDLTPPEGVNLCFSYQGEGMAYDE